MTELLYLNDSYLKEFEAVVESVKDGKFIVLDKTAFYPSSGGQPYDTGIIKKENDKFNVVYVGKFFGEISHEVDKPGLKEGDKVNCIIDWERRYKLMRMHTAAHLLSAIFHRKESALITGNQLNVDKSRIDFSSEDFNKEKIISYIEEANKEIERDLPITISYMQRKQALSQPNLAKLEKGLPKGIKKLRIISIGDIDKQADGGTHIKSLKEIGKIIFLKAENKGKKNRRVYFSVE